PFVILERLSLVADRLRLPEELSCVHDIFHVSNLKKKSLADASLHVSLDEIKVDKTLCFVEEPIENSVREVKSLKCSRMVVVKIHLDSNDYAAMRTLLWVGKVASSKISFENLADLIRVADLIIWDEAPLQHRHAFEAVDRTFHNTYILDNPNADNQVFDGKVVMLGGDFQQILPIILNASRVVVVLFAVNKSSRVWDYCKVFVLSINMRLRDPTVDVTNEDEMLRFHNWLIALGDGRFPSIVLDGEGDATWITIPEDLLIPVDDNPVGAIVSNTFSDLLNRIQDINYLKERCILSPTNDVVDKINSHLLALMSDEMHELLSADMIFAEYGQTRYRPLYSKIFVQFGFKTSAQPSFIRPELFDRYAFKFVLFVNLQHRIGNDTYLIDVVGVLRAWGPLQGSVGKNQGCNPQLRKIVIFDTSDIKLNIPLWGKCALTYVDNVIKSKKDTNIVVVLTCYKVGFYSGGPELKSTASSQIHLNLPIAETIAYSQRLIYLVSFTMGTESNELKVTTIPDIYKRLADDVTLVQVSDKEDNSFDTTDYAIHDENLGSTITEYEEKLMDKLEWGHGKEIVDTEPAVVETHVNDFTHDVLHPAKAETRGVTSWISSQHNSVNNRESLHA
ncbi:replication protein A 70 kDa DNA-binding subunit B, partial [Tanacetum coccineum]